MFDQATAAREVASVSLNSRTSKISCMPICSINLKEINHLHNPYGWHKIVIDEFMQKKGQIEVKDEDPCASVYTPFPKTHVHTFHNPFPTLTVIINFLVCNIHIYKSHIPRPKYKSQNKFLMS